MKTPFRSALALSVLLLAGCEMATPSQVQVRDIEIRRGIKSETVDLARPDVTRAEMVAASYRNSGSGPVSVTASYLPSGVATARKNGAVWRDLLVRNGMPDVSVSYVAVTDPAYAGKAVITWSALLASPPKGCGRIPGHNGAENYMESYQIGCEIQANMARQIARPADLLGKAGVSENESLRDATMVNKNRIGTPNPKIDKMQASDVSPGGG